MKSNVKADFVMPIAVLMLICLVMSALLAGKSQPAAVPAQPAAQTKAPAVSQPADNDLMISDRKMLDAIVSASIASYIGDEGMEGLRIHSIRRIGGTGAADQNELIAVIGAVMAAIN